MSSKQELAILEFKTPNEFENWLNSNYELKYGIWIKLFKKRSGIQTILYDEALNLALCYGWIDGQKKTYDELAYLQKFTPRRKNSVWSKRNIAKAEELIIEGKMKPSGLHELNNAKSDGRYAAAYDKGSNMEIPQYFMAELSKNIIAHEFFKTLNKANLFAIGFRLQTARDENLRAKRMMAIISKLGKNEKFH